MLKKIHDLAKVGKELCEKESCHDVRNFFDQIEKLSHADFMPEEDSKKLLKLDKAIFEATHEARYRDVIYLAKHALNIMESNTVKTTEGR